MSEILYNTNSTFISKFHQQQHRASHEIAIQKKAGVQNLEDLPRDSAFRSAFCKESDSYLKELCKSVYPNTVRRKIDSISNPDRLNFHALVSLLVKNFVLNWYGVKISIIDIQGDDFLLSIFQTADNTYTNLANALTKKVDIEYYILEHLPKVISLHLATLRELSINEEQLNVDNYCRLHLLPSGEYLQNNYIAIILEHFDPNQSILQKTLLRSILHNIIFGSILDSISNTFYVLDLINNIFIRLNDRKRVLMPHNNNNEHNPSRIPINVLQSSLLSLVIVDICQLPIKNPFWFSLLNVLIKIALFVPFLNSYIANKAEQNLSSLLAGPLDVSLLLRKLRNTLFPNDNLMGQRRIIPEGKELELFKAQVIRNVWLYFQNKATLRQGLLITEKQIESLINLISLNHQCNKIFLLQMIEPVVVLLVSNEDAKLSS
ncbi:hypothetical protein RNJ44_04711 [Nakaseomyces bracarensis]|uniref:PXA domain-containing protein n=1 Tax=Nakaseomyces bracarensis TaxID=273131 RepID=A0ABR4NVN4_9SACH